MTTGTGNYTLTDTGSATGTHTYSGNSLHQDVTGDGATGKISESQAGDTRYSKLSIYGTLAFNDPSDAGSGLSGVTGLSAVGAMVQVEGYFPAATGSPSSVGDAAYKYCFAAGTRVLLSDGTSQAIEKLETGQEVLALPEGDPQAQPRACRIVQVFHNAPARIFDLKVAGEVIRTTAGHPFYVRGKGWVKVRDLAKGDELRTDQGLFLKVQSIVDSGKTEPVFNLEVQGDHTYFVRLPESGVGVWVHNQSMKQWWAQQWKEFRHDLDEGIAELHDDTESAANSIEDSSLKSGNSFVAAAGGAVSGGMRAGAGVINGAATLENHPLKTLNAVQQDPVGTRVMGGLQVVGGVVEVVAGAAAAPTIIATALGVVLVSNGIDNVYHGSERVIDGQNHQTWTSAAVEAVTGSHAAGECTNAAIMIGGTGAMGGINNAVNAGEPLLLTSGGTPILPSSGIPGPVGRSILEPEPAQPITKDFLGNVPARITITNGVADVELGFVVQMDEAEISAMRDFAVQNGAKSAVVRFEAVNPDVAINMGLRAQSGRTYLGGIVKDVSSDGISKFEIHFNETGEAGK